jgi:hypothetical protein
MTVVGDDSVNQRYKEILRVLRAPAREVSAERI